MTVFPMFTWSGINKAIHKNFSGGWINGRVYI